jgi:hypothetical protein
MRARQEQITFEASGDGLKERGAAGVVDGRVVEWDEDGSNVRPGPNASKYESVRKECGAHILPNAGLAASRMEARFRMYLACRAGPDGQMYGICQI